MEKLGIQDLQCLLDYNKEDSIASNTLLMMLNVVMPPLCVVHCSFHNHYLNYN